MLICKKSSDLQNALVSAKEAGKKVGFVPTMGALHDGHISLIRAAKNFGCDFIVASVFVNPTQFNNAEDLEKYPRTLENDIFLLEQAGCNALFVPETSEMYPADEVPVTYDFGYLENILEGAFRPGHFKGVGIIVAKLLKIVAPDFLFMGEKDLQQCRVVANLLKQMGLPEELLVVCPTIREKDGLAMSSRNRRLSESGRSASLLISSVLFKLKENYGNQTISELLTYGKNELERGGMKVEYLEIVNYHTLLPISSSDEPADAVVAAWCDGVRLIDNLPLNG